MKKHIKLIFQNEILTIWIIRRFFKYFKQHYFKLNSNLQIIFRILLIFILQVLQYIPFLDKFFCLKFKNSYFFYFPHFLFITNFNHISQWPSLLKYFFFCSNFFKHPKTKLLEKIKTLVYYFNIMTKWPVLTLMVP